jgi:hypothetical protein
MEPGQPDVLEQVPAGGGMNKPASGTYGEDVSLERLKAALPESDPEQPEGIEPTPLAGQGSPVPPPDGTLPSELFAPTRRPDTPVSTPLQELGPTAPGDREEELLQILELISRDPERTAASREWAQMVLDGAIRAR